KIATLNQHKLEPLSPSALQGLISGIPSQLTDKITSLEAENKQLRENLSCWQADYAKLESYVERELDKPREPKQQETGYGVKTP
ncbi:hypothetical protein, partial [Campylobacter concisus]|uniref:hypothetical protein n=1 Tax=Campylobacter concisus TaxID=199 RepID=UPI001CA5DF8B